jgi:TatD DNase family protein
MKDKSKGKNMLVDSHSHLDFQQFDSDRSEMLQRALDAGVGYMISIGTSDQTSQNALDLSIKYPFIFASAGVHPLHTNEPQDWERICQMAEHERVVAIGETGLDFYHENDPKIIDEQRIYFAKHFELSNRLKKPLIIHSRGGAFEEIFEFRRRYGLDGGGVIHCFTGNTNEALEAIELGFYLSISGVITYKKTEELKEAVRIAPLDRILVETDCPYLAPMPHRGKRNEPSFVTHTAQEVARIKGISYDALCEATTQNCKHLFKLP